MVEEEIELLERVEVSPQETIEDLMYHCGMDHEDACKALEYILEEDEKN